MQGEPKDRVKKVVFDQEAHLGLAKGVEIMRKAVGSTYGPGGRNVLIKKKYVHPVLTRDGVTVARDMAGYGNRLDDELAAEAGKLVYQASEKTNKTAGDGTTATVVLLAELYKAGLRRITAGDDPMKIKKLLDANRDIVLSFVKSQSVKCTEAMLKQVAYIASGDKALADMISDLVWDVGSDGAITISYHNAPHVEVEKITGYLFDQGFANLAAELEFAAPKVLVTQKRMATKADVIPLLNLVGNDNRLAQVDTIIIGDVAGAAMETILWADSNQKANVVVIPPPAFGSDGHDYFEDIAIYTGANLILEGDDFKSLTLEHLGTVKRARLTREKAVLFGDNTTGNAISDRIKQIQDQLRKTDVTPSLKEQLEQRYAKLAGKISVIKVGAPTDVEREELFFRVEDAVEACKSALSSGIVAGGATTLLFASSIRKAKSEVLESFVKEALAEPFRLLMANAGEDGGYRLNQVLNAGYGQGFDIRNMSDEPLDLLGEGIIDATKVVLQVVKNAFSVAGALLTTGTVIIEEDEPTKVSTQG